MWIAKNIATLEKVNGNIGRRVILIGCAFALRFPWAGSCCRVVAWAIWSAARSNLRTCGEVAAEIWFIVNECSVRSAVAKSGSPVMGPARGVVIATLEETKRIKCWSRPRRQPTTYNITNCGTAPSNIYPSFILTHAHNNITLSESVMQRLWMISCVKREERGCYCCCSFVSTSLTLVNSWSQHKNSDYLWFIKSNLN